MGALAAVCAVSLWFPSDADESMFATGAARLASGAVYYRDFWDIKQPGIYWFYQVGGALGLGGMGVRVLEVGLALVTGFLLWRVTAGWRLHPLARIAAPTLVLGSYVLLSHRSGIGQIEGLYNPLLVMMVAAAWPARPGAAAHPGQPGRENSTARPEWRWLLAGLAAGVLGVFKLLYLPLAAVALLGALVDTPVGVGGRVRRAAAGILGALLPLLAAVGYFAINGALRLAWVTSVRIPFEAVGQSVLSEGKSRYLELLIGLIGLIVLAAVALAGSRRRGTVLRDATFSLLVLLAAVLAWPQYATPYRMLVLVAPLGLLAVQGVSTVLEAVDRRAATGTPGAGRRLRLAVAAVAVLLALPMGRGPERLVAQAGQIPSWGLTADARLQRDLVLTSEPLAADADPMRSLISPGQEIYVLGDPRIYQLLGANEAIEISGWSAGLMPAPVWAERDRELVRSRPEFVFVEADLSQQVAQRSPRLTAMLATRYRTVATTPGGTWYRTADPGQPSGIPGDNRLAG